jgi:2-oxoglutarate dehydrogenase E2 component (dihydrolipoamide succinyltransferase)
LPAAAPVAAAPPRSASQPPVEAATPSPTAVPDSPAVPADDGQKKQLVSTESRSATQVSALHGAPPRSEEIVPMTWLRQRVAKRLVEAQNTGALLTTFNEVDMSAVIEIRQQYRDAFQERYNAKLGFMSFFVKATIESLKACPELNAEIRDNSIVYRNFYDISIAVGGGKGLVVPVVRNAELLSFAEIEQTIGDFAARAKSGQLKPDELMGGTFTITNGGVFGSMLSTPIVNPPQSGILGLHAIQDRPVARNGQVVIRPMMYVALTYDHRIVDGREAVGFLKRIKEFIEEPSRLLLQV